MAEQNKRGSSSLIILVILTGFIQTSAFLYPSDNSSELETEYKRLDSLIFTWWEKDLSSAFEKDIREDKGTLLYLPFPYSTAGGSEKSFPEMYGWDTYFINLAMLQHGLTALVKNHILNHLFMIEKYGYVLNANRVSLSTRSQPPLLAESVMNYFRATGDTSLLMLAFPLLEKEYNNYWNSGRHLTPVGLSTCIDTADKTLRTELASEAESGLDFTACYGGNISDCVPLHINCILVKYAANLSEIAALFGLKEKAVHYANKAAERAEQIRSLCWNQEDGFFYEYNYVKKEQIKVRSLCAYWTMWAGAATDEQAKQLVKNLKLFVHAGGLSFTAENYASPHKEFSWLQWGYPVAWPPMHIITDAALRNYNYNEQVDSVSVRYLNMALRIFKDTGSLWEKYNAAEAGTELLQERKGYINNPMHGWSSAAIVLLGQNYFNRSFRRDHLMK